ncbi:methyltransferase [Candidatus Sumerlaeota bacterium]|nr:methyltransferase [Candidatus Sumerlaeota bacterium]
MGNQQSAIEIILGSAETARKSDLLLDGALCVKTSHGLDPLNRMLIEGAQQTPAERIVSILTPDALPAAAMARLRPESKGLYFHIDLYHTRRAEEAAQRNAAPKLDCVCAPNLPMNAEPDLALLWAGPGPEQGLLLEMLRQAHARMKKGGKLLTAINNPRDQWLRRQIERTFGNVSVLQSSRKGTLYSAKKKDDPSTAAPMTDANQFMVKLTRAKAMELVAEFNTCYGVFCNGALDAGSRALLNALDGAEQDAAVLDLGCGWGALGIFYALKHGAKRLTLIDSNARAMNMAGRNSALLLNGAPVSLRHEDRCESILNGEAETGAYDVVLSNPPYSTEFAVMELFVNAAHRALRPGGQAWFVTKSNPKLHERLQKTFRQIQTQEKNGYVISRAVK